jgi:vitamin B12 transporter
MKASLLSLILLMMLTALAQEPAADSIRQLAGIEVSARRIERFNAGSQVIKFNNEELINHPSASLSEFLISKSTLNLRTYGGSGLSTLAMRGAAAQHTAVYWNGISINPPNITMADLSMIPVFLFRKIELNSGGNSAVYGNGNIGGSIHLDSQNGTDEQLLRLALNGGSYGERMMAAKASYSLGKLQVTTSAWLKNSENNYRYTNITKFNNPVEQLSNADAAQYGLLHEMRYFVNKRHTLRGGFWHQFKEAGIPPSMTMNRSLARQTDRMTRAYTQWNYHRGIFNTSLKSAFTSDYLNYFDEATAIDSHINVSVWLTETEILIQPARHTQMIAGAAYQFHNAKVDNYPDNVNPLQASVFLLFNHELPSLDWTFSAGYRQEFHSHFSGIRPAISLGWRGRILDMLAGRFNISTNYRTPTLNDRFWQPGGNPDLKPETSLNLEAGLDAAMVSRKLKWSATFFNNYIDNWITWLPSDQSYWKPFNINKVNVLGAESSLTAFAKMQYFKHEAALSYAFTRSIYGNDNQSTSKERTQLIYTPLHNAALNYTLRYNSYSLSYAHRFTGPRFTDRANTQNLPAFHTIDLSATRRIEFKKLAFNLNLEVKNLTNHQYQLIAYRPMPGRTFHISLIADILFDHQSSTKTKKL